MPVRVQKETISAQRKGIKIKIDIEGPKGYNLNPLYDKAADLAYRLEETPDQLGLDFEEGDEK
jgi:hypothetical protein